MHRETLIAVLDTETTGLFPGGHDRIVEVAALLMTPTGEVRDTYETLVNPQRDMGPTHIHGIRAEEAIVAPTFEEIAGDLCQFLSRAGLLVGHNILFDLRFIQAELARMGVEFDWQAPKLDTFWFTRLSLEDSCYQFDLPISFDFHSAMGDVGATASLALTLQREGEVELTPSSEGVGLPLVAPREARTVTRAGAADITNKNSGFLSTLSEQVAYSLAADEKSKLEYFSLLSMVLEDRVLDRLEAQVLRDFAAAAGFGRSAIRSLHIEFLDRLVAAALADNIITEHEHADLSRVARLLDLDQEVLGELVEEHTQSPRVHVSAESDTCDLEGKTICFSGTILSTLHGEVITKQKAKELAEAAGLITKTSVSRKLDILVVADPDSISGKAKKARDYGIRIIVERDFWPMIGVEIT